MRTITVGHAAGAYPVLVGPGTRDALAELLPPKAARAAIVTQESVPWDVETALIEQRFLIPPGEEAKSLATVEKLCRGFSRFGLSRHDVVVGVGGGVVTDTAGFAAAVYQRGVQAVHVATTLLAQVDAAVGGKTGVNLPEGKNLVGAFWQPAGVICDIETLKTLDEREYRSGLGEMAKYAFLGVEGLASMGIEDAVAACVGCKAAIVSTDERETTGRRSLLNYGHTLAHALETAGQYQLRHGEAVAIGLCFAARLARRLGRIDDKRVAEHERLVASYGLPTHLPDGADPDELMTIMSRDKKGALTFVLDGTGGLEVVPGIDPAVVREAL